MTTAPNSFRRNVTREHPATIVLTVDLSASMQSEMIYQGDPMLRCEVAARAVNSILRELVYKSKVGSDVRDYFEVMIVVYGGRGACSLFEEQGGAHFAPISKIAQMGAEGMILSLETLTPFIKQEAAEGPQGSPFVLQSQGETPMYEALYLVLEVLQERCAERKYNLAVPPIVINATDGHPTDSSLSEVVEMAERIKSIETEDGPTLLFNFFLASDSSQGQIFPTEQEVQQSHSEFFRAMAQAASPMPSLFDPLVRELRGDTVVKGSYRAVGFNISVEEMIAMMAIGTQVTTK